MTELKNMASYAPHKFTAMPVNIVVDGGDTDANCDTVTSMFTAVSSANNSYNNTVTSGTKEFKGYRPQRTVTNNNLDTIFNHDIVVEEVLDADHRNRAFSKSNRRYNRFYSQKVVVYKFLQRPRGPIAVGYHLIVSCIVFSCLILTVFSSIKEYEEYAALGLKYSDIVILVIFTVELLMRIWSSTCITYFRGWDGFLRFMWDPFRLIDIVVIFTTMLALSFETNIHQVLSLSFRGLRIFQLFQVMRLEFRFRPWKMMASVIWSQREHLAISVYLGFLALLFVSFIVYFCEKDVNPMFSNIAASMWWGVVTFGTVGYGDIYPVTAMGKFLSCVFFIFGVSLFALPAGILGTGLALKVEESKRQRLWVKRKPPAVRLIQTSWRLKSSQRTTGIFWKAYLAPNTRYTTLSLQQINAIRFILAAKHMVARRYFLTASKPYDIKDVLEQYASGQADLLGGVRLTQSGIDAILATVHSNYRELRECKKQLSVLTSLVENSASRDKRRDRDSRMKEYLPYNMQEYAVSPKIHNLPQNKVSKLNIKRNSF